MTISGLSKTFSITGWRLGYCIAPAEMSNGIRKAHDFLTVGAPHPLQVAGRRGAGPAASYYDEAARPTTRAAATCSCRTCARPASTVHEPEGAYYVMTDVSPLGWDDDTAFVRAMIEQVGVSAVPGSSFYTPKELGRTKVRFMFAKQDETLHEAGERLRRLKEMLK